MENWDISLTQDIRDIQTAFEQTGFVVLREVLATDKVEATLGRLKDEFARLNMEKENLPAELTKHLERNEMPAEPALAPFRLNLENYDVITASDRLRQAMGLIIGEEFFWHYPAMFRKMEPKNRDGLLPYHQDYTYNSKYQSCFTCWIPFNPCGKTSPSLEVVSRYMTEKLDHSAKGPWEFGVSESEVARLADNVNVFTLQLEPSDVVIFNDLTLHRTFCTSAMSEPRWSMDARAIPRSIIDDNLRSSRRFISSAKATFGVL
jgi:ectoine hydroxylase-related dioxygenase (phytanoyl-CoA dioxygenase family)